MSSEKVTLDNPVLVASADAIAAAREAGRIDDEEAEALAMWEYQLMDARSVLAKVFVLLESHDSNRQPLLSAAIAWAVLSAKVSEPTTLRPGWLLPEAPPPPPPTAAGQTIPPPTPPPIAHIWALTKQPVLARAAAAKVWGSAHPRAAEFLVTDLGGFPVSHLVDAVLLGQRLYARVAPNRAVTANTTPPSAPYPSMDRCVMVPEQGIYEDEERQRISAAGKAMIERYAPTPTLKMMFENARYVASNPKDYLQWGVATEVRKFLYPLLSSAFKGDATKLEYVRIAEEDVARIIEEQNRAGAAAEGGTTSAGSGAGSGVSLGAQD